MILSGRDIRWYQNEQLLGIEPVTNEQYQQNGVDLVLDRVSAPGRSPLCEYLWPLLFYLGATRETLTLPNNLMGFVELRSTWARRGLLIAPTIIDAGFHGNLTVEIFSAGFSGQAPLGERFLHVVFALLLSPGEPYRGKYQNQQGITEAKD